MQGTVGHRQIQLDKMQELVQSACEQKRDEFKKSKVESKSSGSTILCNLADRLYRLQKNISNQDGAQAISGVEADGVEQIWCRGRYPTGPHGPSFATFRDQRWRRELSDEV